MSMNRLPPPMVTNGVPPPIEVNRGPPPLGMSSGPPPIGLNRGISPGVQGPPPVGFNRVPTPLGMARPPPPFLGRPPPAFNSGPPPYDLNRGPPPVGFNTPPPPRGIPPSQGAQVLEHHQHIPQGSDQVPPVQSSSHSSPADGKSAVHHFPQPPHFHHNPSKETFHGQEFAMNDFIQFPPPQIPHVFDGHTSTAVWPGGPSPNSSNIEPAVHKIGEESMEDLDKDQKWIENFEQRIFRRPSQPTKKKNQLIKTLKLSEVQDLISQFHGLMQTLEGLKDEMRVKCTKADDHDWNTLVMETEDIKQKLLNMKHQFQDEEFIKRSKCLINQRQKKRKRVKKGKQRLRLEKVSQKLAQQKEEEKIDAWREKLEEQEKEKRREKAVKLEADSILGEVRQKQSEALRMQQLLESLATLRQARVKKGASHGYLSTPKDDVHFSSTNKAISEVVATQMKEYQLEEQTLRVMMGESSHHTYEGNELNAAISRREAALSKLMFGDFTPIHFETMKKFTAAEDSWEMVLQRRYEWDQYLTEEKTPLASSIPINWVIPPVNPAKDWAQYQT